MNPEREESNADTVAAIRERDEMIKHPEKYKRYSSVAEVMEEEA